MNREEVLIELANTFGFTNNGSIVTVVTPDKKYYRITDIYVKMHRIDEIIIKLEEDD